MDVGFVVLVIVVIVLAILIRYPYIPIGIGLFAIIWKLINVEKEKIELQKNMQARMEFVNDDPFDSQITPEVFEDIVFACGKTIRKRKIRLDVKGTDVYGMVESQSGLNSWNFRLDFNDGGNVTGRFWIYCDNEYSEIPRTLGERISECICDTREEGRYNW